MIESTSEHLCLIDGDIALTYVPFDWKKPLTVVSHLIRKITGFRWHHTFHINTIGSGSIPMVNEIDQSKVKLYPLANSNPRRQVKVFRINRDSSEDFDINRSLSRIGKTRYDFRGLVFHHIALRYLGIWIGPKTEGKAYERFVCSEYTAWIEKLPYAYRLTPKDIHDWCTENGTVIFEGKVTELIDKACC